MAAIIARISDEPILAITLVQSVLTLAVTFGANLTAPQIGAILTLTGAVLAVWARGKVTPA